MALSGASFAQIVAVNAIGVVAGGIGGGVTSSAGGNLAAQLLGGAVSGGLSGAMSTGVFGGDLRLHILTGASQGVAGAAIAWGQSKLASLSQADVAETHGGGSTARKVEVRELSPEAVNDGAKAFTEADVSAMEAAVAARADKGGGCMSCAMAALDIDASDLNVPRGQKSRVHDIAAAAGAPEVQHDIDFKVRGKSHGSFELSYRGDARPAAVISNATSRTGGSGVFITGPADGTHTALVIARPQAGGGYSFSYLDQVRLTLAAGNFASMLRG